MQSPFVPQLETGPSLNDLGLKHHSQCSILAAFLLSASLSRLPEMVLTHLRTGVWCVHPPHTWSNTRVSAYFSWYLHLGCLTVTFEVKGAFPAIFAIAGLGVTGLADGLVEVFWLSLCVIRGSWDSKLVICLFRSWISFLESEVDWGGVHFSLYWK